MKIYINGEFDYFSDSIQVFDISNSPEGLETPIYCCDVEHLGIDESLWDKYEGRFFVDFCNEDGEVIWDEQVDDDTLVLYDIYKEGKLVNKIIVNDNEEIVKYIS